MKNNFDTCEIEPVVLILSSRLDYTSDYVVSRLRRRSARYFRINSDDISDYHVTLDPLARELRLRNNNVSVTVREETLTSILYRLPTFLRASYLAVRPLEERFERTHWLTFLNSLTLFQSARWINGPVETYRAEFKPLQLSLALRLGFDVPRTVVTNSLDAWDELATDASDVLALKGVDTVIERTENEEYFGYTNMLAKRDVVGRNVASAPFVLQQAVQGKLDLRVSIVGDKVWCASIVDKAGDALPGDWRIHQRNAVFCNYTLPAPIAERCVLLTRLLGLEFAAIDLALADGKYYFLEVNPTGEWAWLQESLGFEIADSIADSLLSKALEL